jgi:hypothetical protein
MACAFFTLLTLVGGIAALVWLGWRRVAAHLRKNPEVAKLIAQHVLAPMLFGEDEQEKPEPKKIKATPVQEGG